MSEDTTQAVVEETKVSAQPDTAETGARVEQADDLDTLLKEFDTAEKAAESTKPEQKAGAADDQSSELAERVRRMEEADRLRNLERINQEVDALARKIQGDTKIPLRLIKGWIDQRARETPDLGGKYFSADASGRERLSSALSRDFHKEMREVLIDPNATEDRAAVAAAVRGASTKAPEGKAPDYSKMSDAELRAEKEKLGM